jgi:6-phosphogluconolactonase
MSNSVAERRFTDKNELTEALAQMVVAHLTAAVHERGEASLVVSGGTTPGPLFDRLSSLPAPWDRVTVTVSDERWVGLDSPMSNEQLLRTRLITGQAARLQMVPIKNAHPEPEQAEVDVSAALQAMPRPYDLLILGMGENMHTASLFPHADGLKAALDLDDPMYARAIRPIPPDDAEPPRMTLTLRAILDSRLIVILFTGEKKWAAYQQALAGDDIEAAPVRAVLQQTQTPVQVWWAP